MMNFVFDTLWASYFGKVMLRPGIDEYLRYRQDNGIVIMRLPGETPPGIAKPWESRLEKILVDVFSDRFISTLVSDGEKRNIVESAFREYLIERHTLFHYARRKGAEKKIRGMLSEYGRGEADR